MQQNRWQLEPRHRPHGRVYNSPKDTADLAGIEVCMVCKFLDLPLGEVRFSLQLYTRLHGFKYEFSKFSGEGLTEPPPQTPPPAQTRAPPSIRASLSILGRFAPSVRASSLILLGRFAPSVRASPSIHPSDMLIPHQQRGTR